jgi:hypothetical protein
VRPLLVLAVAPLVVVLVAGCTRADRPVPVSGVVLVGEDVLGFGTVCLPPDRLQASVAEDTRSVTLTVTGRGYDPDNTDGCATYDQVQLAAPLGDRTVVDGSTGREVRVDRG